MEFLQRVHINGDQRIGHRQIKNVFLVSVLDLTGVAGGGSAQKSLNHFTAGDEGMAVAAVEFWNHRPDMVGRSQERLLEHFDGFNIRRRTVNQGDNSGVATAAQHLIQANAQRTELSIIWVAIGDKKCAIGIDGWSYGLLIASRNHNDQVTRSLER